MKKWIEVTDLKTGKPVLVNIDHISCVSAALQPGNAYGMLTIENICIVSKEPYSEIKKDIEEAMK